MTPCKFPAVEKLYGILSPRRYAHRDKTKPLMPIRKHMIKAIGGKD